MGVKILVTNRRAYRDYEIQETFEAGVSLQGTEVKSSKMGKISVSDGWVDIVGGEAYLKSVSIALYTHGNIRNHEEKRDRKLLLHKKEIINISRAIEEKGFTVVPLKVYLKDSLIKFEIGVARGRKLYDKREYDKKKQAQVAIGRAMKR